MQATGPRMRIDSAISRVPEYIRPVHSVTGTPRAISAAIASASLGCTSPSAPSSVPSISVTKTFATLPMSELNQLRRRLVADLQALRRAPKLWQLRPEPQLREESAPESAIDKAAELIVLVDGSAVFNVLAHCDYPRRYWPAGRVGKAKLLSYLLAGLALA